MSAAKVVTRGIGFIATRSTPIDERFLADGSNSHIDNNSDAPRTDDQTVHGHCLARNLKPSPRRSAKVYTTSCGFQEGVFLVQLNKFEGGTSAVPLFSVGDIMVGRLKPI